MIRWVGLLAAALTISACAPTAQQAFSGQLAHARARGTPFLIYAFGVPGEIQAAGDETAVPVYVQFVVTSPKPLAQVEFTLVGYSQRGKPIRRHGKPMAVVLIGPGPFDPEGNYEVNSFHAQPAGFPGGDVACVELAGARITYRNGENVSFDVEQLRASLLPVLRKKGCTDRGPEVSNMFSDH